MPSNTTSSVRFYYIYILESIKDKNRYVGYTTNLKQRLETHQKGKNFATAPRIPFKLVYFEGCTNMEDARRREQYLKTTQGRRFLGLRLQEHQRSKTSGISGS